MKRLTSLTAMTLLLLSTEAAAETKSAIVYIPVDDLTLSPSGSGPCADVSLSAWNSGLGCVPGLDAAQVYDAHADAANLATAVSASVAAFDVHVTTVRPPTYVPYYVLVPGENTNDESQSYSCVGGPLVCAGRGRDLIAFTNTGTLNCTAPDTLQTLLYALGRLAGLEGSTDPAGAMHYPPDFVVPADGYVDGCVTLSQQIGGDDGMTVLPLECTSVDHSPGGCGAGQQHPHAELLDVFGPATEDTDAPVITVVSPEDGAVLPEGSTLEIEMTVADANPHVAVLLDVASPALDGIDQPALQDGTLSACTSSWCDFHFLDNDPFRLNDGPWTFDLPGLPPGVYTITFAATDYDGNESQVVHTVNIGDDPGPGTTSGSSSSSGGDESDTTGSSTGGAESTGGTLDPGTTSTTTSSSTSTSGATTAVGTTSSTSTTTSDEETEGDTDTSGAATLDEGCGCRSSGPRSPLQLATALLLFVGILRRPRARR